MTWWYENFGIISKPKYVGWRKVNNKRISIYVYSPVLFDDRYNALTYGTRICVSKLLYDTRHRDATIAHELGHIACGHTNHSRDVLYVMAEERDRREAKAIQREVDADTWAATNGCTKESLDALRFICRIHNVAPNDDRELIARMDNLNKLLAKEEK